MRFMTRSLLGVALMALTIALVGVGLRTVSVAYNKHQDSQNRRAGDRERVYTVTVAPVQVATAKPKITSYGEIESGRTLELRAVRGGTLVEIGESFRDGGVVQRGDLLFATNPADAQSARDVAETDLLDAEGELIDARLELELAGAERITAERQYDLRRTSVARQEDLIKRGVGTEAALETAALAASSAEQALVNRRQTVARAQARLKRAEVGLKRRKIALTEAERVLDDTRLKASFDGVLSGISAVEGRLVSSNETLGTLIDPTALEAAFRVSTDQYGRLTAARDGLRDVQVDVTLALDSGPIVVTGRIDRVGAEVGESQVGRMLFAKLDATAPGQLLPGDFVSVTIIEPELRGVSEVPSEAVNSNGRMLLLADDDRLEAAQVTVARRQGDVVLVRGLPAGREFVTNQQPQLGPGVKVKPVRSGQGLEEAQMVVLEPARRDRLVAAIEGNGFIPKDRKAQILERLKGEKVPLAIVERIEARLGGGGGATGGARVQGGGADGPKIALAKPRRDKLRAFVEGNQRMPGEIKTRILKQLDEDEVSQALIERLEARMGG